MSVIEALESTKQVNDKSSRINISVIKSKSQQPTMKFSL